MNDNQNEDSVSSFESYRSYHSDNNIDYNQLSSTVIFEDSQLKEEMNKKAKDKLEIDEVDLNKEDKEENENIKYGELSKEDDDSTKKQGRRGRKIGDAFTPAVENNREL